MPTASCCLPTVIPTRAPWHLRAWNALSERLNEAVAAWRRESAQAACTAALRRLSPQTLHDIGLAGCVRPEPTLPRVDWEYGRWQ